MFYILSNHLDDSENVIREKVIIRIEGGQERKKVHFHYAANLVDRPFQLLVVIYL